MDNDKVIGSKELIKISSKENEKGGSQYKVFRIGTLNFIKGETESRRFICISFAKKTIFLRSVRHELVLSVKYKTPFTIIRTKSYFYLYLSFRKNSAAPHVLVFLSLPLLILFLTSQFLPSVAEVISRPIITTSFANLLLSLFLWGISYIKKQKNTAIKLTNKSRAEISKSEALFFDEIETEFEMLVNRQPAGN